MFEILLLFGVVYLLFEGHALKKRVNILEHSELPIKKSVAKTVSDDTGLLMPNIKREIAGDKALSYNSNSTNNSEYSTNPEPEISGFVHFIIWLKDDWLMKLGGLVLLMGFGWFITYAFMNDWIGEVGRIVLGLLAGTAFLVYGFVRMQKYVNQGGSLLVIGSTIVLMVTFAARGMYDIFTPLSALIIMFLSTGLVAFSSVKYNSRALAIASLLLASIAPLLTNAPTTDNVGLFSYLSVVIVGTIWITMLTGYRELTTISLMIVSLYSTPHLIDSRSTSDILIIFAFSFVTIFFVSNVISILRSKGANLMPDILTAIGNGVFLLAWIVVVIDKDWQSLVIAAWTLVFAVAGFSIFRITSNKAPFFVYSTVCISFLAAATAVELSGADLAIAYTLEAAIVPIIAYAILRDLKVATSSMLLMIVPGWMVLDNFFDEQYNYLTRSYEISVSDILSLIVFSLSLIAVAIFFRIKSLASDKETRNAVYAAVIVGSVYFYGFIWKLAHYLIESDPAVMVSLIIYTAIGLIVYILGKNRENKSLRTYGGVLMAFVVLRLFVNDVWDMELFGRIVTFFAVGILLISTALIGRNNKHVQS